MAEDKSVEETRVRTLLRTVFEDCMDEDSAVRESQLREWKQLKLLWEGFTRVWYDSVAHDWRVWNYLESNPDSSDQAYYDRPVNVFKAYLETIVAALSVSIPPVKCFPENADDPLDIATAKAGDKIAQIVFRHNKATLLWLRSLFVLQTEGAVACHTRPIESEEYGTYKEDETEDYDETVTVERCPNCGFETSSEATPESQQELPIAPEPQLDQMGLQQPEMQQPQMMQETAPELPPEIAQIGEQLGLIPPQGQMAEGQADVCPGCGEMTVPEISQETFSQTRIIKTNIKPKKRVCLDVYGGLNIKIPNYAKSQAGCPYLIFSEESDYSLVLEKYKDLDDKDLKKSVGGGNVGSYSEYAQWARLSPQYQGDYPKNVVTVDCAWIRPAKFNILPKEDAEFLKKKYPKGAKVTFVSECFAEAISESLDDHWTITNNPMSDYIHFEPMGRGLVSIQDITNDLISLTLQTIEHGVGQTFADSAVLDFKAYEKTEVTPGGVFPATARSGKSLADGFHELRTAILSGEVMPFFQNVQSIGQLAIGAQPTLFGGALRGSETASEYSMARAQALQRLQNTWRMMISWWIDIFGKAIPMYIDSVKETNEDERDVQVDNDGNFINVVIRKSELEGKIGKVELESDENLPITWSQRRDLVKELIASSNPAMMSILNAPENLSIIHEALGLVELSIPGEDDIVKQYDEIKQLLTSEPTPNPAFNPDPMAAMADPTAGEEFLPSVPIDPIIDNHQIEFGIVRKWAVSETGRLAKVENEPGYMNVLLHGKMHFAQMQMQMMQQQMQQQQQDAQGKPKKDTKVPIEGEGDVATV